MKVAGRLWPSEQALKQIRFDRPFCRRLEHFPAYAPEVNLMRELGGGVRRAKGGLISWGHVQMFGTRGQERQVMRYLVV
jgi:hypothetical protein